MIEVFQGKSRPLVRSVLTLHDGPDLKVIRVALHERGAQWHVTGGADGGQEVAVYLPGSDQAAILRLPPQPPAPVPANWLRNPWMCFVSASDKTDLMMVLMPASKYCPVERPA